jgi:hypothetical protein
VRFLKHIFGYTALHYTADRLHFQLSTCMVCLCKYYNSVSNLYSLAFQQLKSIRYGICYNPLGIFLRYLQHKRLAFLKDIVVESFEGKRY